MSVSYFSTSLLINSGNINQLSIIFVNRPEEESESAVDSLSHGGESQYRRKRGSGTKVGGAAASAKTATKNSGGGKKNFRLVVLLRHNHNNIWS